LNEITHMKYNIIESSESNGHKSLKTLKKTLLIGKKHFQLDQIVILYHSQINLYFKFNKNQFSRLEGIL
jgi:hypothetical protein